MPYKNILISIGLVIAIAVAAWTTFLLYHPQTTTTQKTASLPDAFMEDVTAVIMDKLGRPSMRVVTPKLVHYVENDITEFVEPHLTLYRKSPNPWLITSKFAKASQGMEHVHFWQDVIIHRAADQSNPATVIKTPTLTVHPNKQTADTEDHITLVQPNTIVSALGMHADMNTGDIKLLSDARGEYAPDS